MRVEPAQAARGVCGIPRRAGLRNARRKPAYPARRHHPSWQYVNLWQAFDVRGSG